MSDVTRVRIPLNDQLWLHMDRPGNLMYINALLWFDEVPDWDAVVATLGERMVGLYPVFRRVPVRRGGIWYWEDDPDFDIERQVSRSTLDEPGDRATAEDYVSMRISEQLPADRPRWEVEFIEGYHGHDGEGEGGLALFRVQHGMVDGVRLTQLILSLCDHDDDSTPDSVGHGLLPEQGHLLSTAGRVGAGLVRDSADIALAATRASVLWPWTVARVAKDVVAPGRQVKRVPSRVVESLASRTSPTNSIANTVRSVGRLLLEPHSPELVWSGKAGQAKRVSWVTGVKLDSVKSVSHATSSTITAIILSAVSLGLTEYLRRHGDEPVADLNFMVPISLAPIDDTPGADLGNFVTLLLMRLPLGVDDPAELLAQVTELLTRERSSYEAHLTYSMIVGVAATPKAVSTRLIDFFANKTVGQLTSVPGPRTQVSLAGTPVRGILGWVPMSGDQSMGVCIFSYDGELNIGFTSDAEMVPDPSLLATLVTEKFATFPGWPEDA